MLIFHQSVEKASNPGSFEGHLVKLLQEFNKKFTNLSYRRMTFFHVAHHLQVMFYFLDFHGGKSNLETGIHGYLSRGSVQSFHLLSPFNIDNNPINKTV